MLKKKNVRSIKMNAYKQHNRVGHVVNFHFVWTSISHNKLWILQFCYCSDILTNDSSVWSNDERKNNSFPLYNTIYLPFFMFMFGLVRILVLFKINCLNIEKAIDFTRNRIRPTAKLCTMLFSDDSVMERFSANKATFITCPRSRYGWNLFWI